MGEWKELNGEGWNDEGDATGAERATRVRRYAPEGAVAKVVEIGGVSKTWGGLLAFGGLIGVADA